LLRRVTASASASAFYGFGARRLLSPFGGGVQSVVKVRRDILPFGVISRNASITETRRIASAAANRTRKQRRPFFLLYNEETHSGFFRLE